MSRAASRFTVIAAALALVGVCVMAARPTPAAAISGKQPLAVVLCKFKDKTDEPHDIAYYKEQYSETGAGKRGVFDYWKDVSYGKLDLTGTVVKGWYTVPYNVADWQKLPKGSHASLCAAQATNDIDFNKFAGVVALTNQVGLNEDLSGGPPPTTIAGTTYPSLGRMIAEQDQWFNGILHESGHSFGIPHSRTLSQQPGNSDYGDIYDVMSCLGCIGTVTPWNPRNTGGPGLNAVQLKTAGWLDRNLTSFDNSSCRQQTIQLAALNQPEASGYLSAQLPANFQISKPVGPVNTATDHYTVELRDSTGWDAGIGLSMVLIHLRGADGYSYWVDQSGIAGQYYGAGNVMIEGDEYVDAARNSYVAVNAVDAVAHTATVTLGACKIDADITYTGDTQADYSDPATLKGTLTVRGTSAPIPDKLVTLSLEGQQCAARTDVAGVATCSITVAGKPGAATAGASFAGNPAYNATSGSAGFTINKETTKLTYGGATTSDYNDPFTASATLVDPDGAGGPIANKPVVFKLGASDSCTATTDATGKASCAITPTQVPGSYSIVATFDGDDFYVGSGDTKPFTITRQQTFLTYDGPAKIANDFPATMKGTLTEEKPGGAPVAGRTVTFTLGGGSSAQTCASLTDAAGKAQCTIASVAQSASATTVSAKAAFAGDAFYLASSASATVKLLYYTGRAYGASIDLLSSLLVFPPQADTGSIQTSVRSQTTRSALFASLPLVTGSGLTGSVTTGLGTSTARGTATSVSIGLPGVPVIAATGVEATSTSTCAAATATTKITALKVGGVAVDLSAAPSTINAGVATIRVNEQSPVPGADKGVLVYALHVSAPGVADVIVGAARSDIHNC